MLHLQHFQLYPVVIRGVGGVQHSCLLTRRRATQGPRLFVETHAAAGLRFLTTCRSCTGVLVGMRRLGRCSLCCSQLTQQSGLPAWIRRGCSTLVLPQVRICVAPSTHLCSHLPKQQHCLLPALGFWGTTIVVAMVLLSASGRRET